MREKYSLSSCPRAFDLLRYNTAVALEYSCLCSAVALLAFDCVAL